MVSWYEYYSLRLRKQPGGSTLQLTTGYSMNPHRKLGRENKQYKQNGYGWHHILTAIYRLKLGKLENIINQGYPC